MARQSVLDRSNPNQATVELFVDRTSDGKPFYEEVPVEPIGPDRFRVLASPGLLDGLAAGDVFERRADGRFEVIERSGNLAVQIWYPDEDLGVLGQNLGHASRGAGSRPGEPSRRRRTWCYAALE